MAQDVQTYSVTVPAGTAKASPQTTAIELGSRQVVKLRIVVPPGPRGEVGFQLGVSGVNVIPKNAGAWIVTDDDKIEVDVDDFWQSGSWQVFAYNTGNYPHTLLFTFYSNFVIGVAAAVSPAPIPAIFLAGTQ